MTDFMLLFQFGTRLSLVVALSCCLVGCDQDKRPARAPVEGTVTYRGAPVANANVSFIPVQGEKIATGFTDAQGKFKLGTYELADGALVGSHKVQIIARGPDKAPPPGDDTTGIPGALIPGDPTIPVRYFDVQTSGLTCEVTKEGPNKPVFELKD